MDEHVELGSVNNVQIFSIMRSLHAVNLLNEDLTESFISYLVKRGYDADDMIAMSSKKGGYRKAVHLITLVAQTNPDIKNSHTKHFFNHIHVFVTQCLKEISPINQMRLYNSLKLLTHFKNDKLISRVRNAAFGKTIGDKADFDSEGKSFTSSDIGYFSFD